MTPEICETCGKYRREAYTLEKAIDEMQQDDTYVVITYMKNFKKELN
jgi:hypothetical protein